MYVHIGIADCMCVECVSTHVSACVCVCVCMFVHMCVCTCVYVYTYVCCMCLTRGYLLYRAGKLSVHLHFLCQVDLSRGCMDRRQNCSKES